MSQSYRLVALAHVAALLDILGARFFFKNRWVILNFGDDEG